MVITKMNPLHDAAALDQSVKLIGILCLFLGSIRLVAAVADEDGNGPYRGSEPRFTPDAESDTSEVRLRPVGQRLITNRLQPTTRHPNYESRRYILREVGPDGYTFTPNKEAWIDILEDLSSHIPLPHLTRPDQQRELRASSSRYLRGVEWVPVAREGSRLSPAGLEFSKQVPGETKEVVVRAASSAGKSAGLLAVDSSMSHQSPISQQRLGGQIHDIEGAVDLDWKRQENTRWNNLRGMWG